MYTPPLKTLKTKMEKVRNIPLSCSLLVSLLTLLVLSKASPLQVAGLIQTALDVQYSGELSTWRTPRQTLSTELFHLDVTYLTSLSVQLGIVGASPVRNMCADIWREREKDKTPEIWWGEHCFRQRGEWMQKAMSRNCLLLEGQRKGPCNQDVVWYEVIGSTKTYTILKDRLRSSDFTQRSGGNYLPVR